MAKLPIRRCTSVCAIFVCAVFIFSPTAFAATLAQSEKALNMIADFADRLCVDVPLEGRGDSIRLSGAGKAQLKGVIRKLADIGIDGAVKYQSMKYEGLLQKDLVSALKDRTNCRMQIWNDLKDKVISSAPARIDPATARFGVTLGWKLARYEFIYQSPFPDALAASMETRRDIEFMLTQDRFAMDVASADASQLINSVLLHYGASNPEKHATILLGIAAMRASLIGASANPEHNQQMQRLAHSAIQSMDSSVIQNREALYARILETKPKHVTEVLELLNNR